MNIQVNLIRDSEKRSASPVRLKAILYIVGSVIPLIILIMVGLTIARYIESQSEVRLMQGRWAEAEGKLKDVEELNERLKALSQYDSEVMAWNRTRVLWHAFFEQLRVHVPAEIQLTALQMRQGFERVDGRTIRLIVMMVDGRCIGPNAEASVERLRRAIERDPALETAVERVDIKAFAEDLSEGASAQDRIFQLEIQFYTKAFNEASGK